MTKNINQLGIITKGKYKNSYCIILEKSYYINNSKLYWYTVFKDNVVLELLRSYVVIL